MNYLPSKELLSKVLGHKIWKVMDCNMGTLRYCIYPNKEDEPPEYMFPINIYELAHKCKEWAWDSYRYKLKSGIYIGRKGSLKQNEYGCTDYEEISECADNEPESIFKACQWIIDNRS